MSYRDRLRRHPGLVPATGMTILNFAASGGTARGLVAASVVSALFWSVVLWTAKEQPR